MKEFLLLMGAGMLALGAVSVANATTITLDFNSLPSAQGWGYVSSGVSENSTFSVSGGMLHQDTMGLGFSGGDSTGYVIYNEVDPFVPFTLTVQAQQFSL